MSQEEPNPGGLLSRVSTHFGLGTSQPFLDFVDVDLQGDVPLFLDPTALLHRPDPWAAECVALIQDFFQHVLRLIDKGNHSRAVALLSVMGEPNETHLGFSTGRARGHGIGVTSAEWLWDSLRSSEAVRTGLLEHLEDTILMVEGIGPDLVSDIATNLIRAPLLEYTQDQASLWSIPLTPGVNPGPLWDPTSKSWFHEYATMPMGPHGPFLLVPKSLVRRQIEYDYDEYYTYYILPMLEHEELRLASPLVQVLRSGPRVFHKDLTAKYGRGKGVVVEQTKAHPEVLERYRRDKRQGVRVTSPAMGHTQMAEATGGALPDWDKLVSDLRAIPRGNHDAPAYHEAALRLLTALFAPPLASPTKEEKLHDGRKRIDITFVNAATSGFFHWVGEHYTAPMIFIECKNFGSEIGNPELDQMIGRFAPSRGKFGIIVYRDLENAELFQKRCRDAQADDHGYIVGLSDDDLTSLAEKAKTVGSSSDDFPLLMQRFKALILDVSA